MTDDPAGDTLPGMNQSKRDAVQPRGEARRHAMIQAVIRVLAREGAAGVTLRAVAEETGAAHGTARYYFSTKDEMLAEALSAIVLEQANEVRGLLRRFEGAEDEELGAALAEHLARRLNEVRDKEIARYELFLAAARTGRFQEALEAWASAYSEFFAEREASRGRRRCEMKFMRFLNLMNGLLLQQLAAPVERFEQDVLAPAIADYFADQSE